MPVLTVEGKKLQTDYLIGRPLPDALKLILVSLPLSPLSHDFDWDAAAELWDRKLGIFSVPIPKDLNRFLAAVLRVNRQAIRIQGEIFEANQGQLAKWDILHDGPRLARIQISRPAAGRLGWNGMEFNGVLDPNIPYAWLTDDDLALIGAEVIDGADAPLIVERQ